MPPTDNGSTEERTCPVCGRWDDEHTVRQVGPLSIVGCPLVPEDATFLADPEEDEDAD